VVAAAKGEEEEAAAAAAVVEVEVEGEEGARTNRAEDIRMRRGREDTIVRWPRWVGSSEVRHRYSAVIGSSRVWRADLQRDGQDGLVWSEAQGGGHIEEESEGNIIIF
jgi:hypothetical protein